MESKSRKAARGRAVERAVFGGIPLGVAAALLSVVLFSGDVSKFELAVQASGGENDLSPARVFLSDHGDISTRSRDLVDPVHVVSGGRDYPPLEVGAFGQAEGTIPATSADVVFRAVVGGDEIQLRLAASERRSGRQPLTPRDERMLAIGALPRGASDGRMPVVRVVGGLCVVTAPCELLIWEQNGVIASGWTAEGATIEETPVQVAEGLLRMSIIPNSGQVTLRSEASEQQEYRLDVPIALSSGYVSLTGLEQAELRREVPAEEVIADFFVAGKWWRTHSASGSRVVLPEFESAETTPLEVLRVQVRDESVRQGAAGVRVFVSDRGVLTADGLRAAMTRAGLQVDEQSDAMLRDDDTWSQAAPEAARFVLAQFERSLRGLPEMVYGRPAMLAEAETRREQARWIGGLSILLLGFLAAVYAFGRGMRAEAQYGDLMNEANRALGDGAVEQYREGYWWGILAVSALIMLGFLFVAALYLSRWIV